jgi:hypothetical protein
MNKSSDGDFDSARAEDGVASALAALRAEHAALLSNYGAIAFEIGALRRQFADLIEDLSRQGAQISTLAEEISAHCNAWRSDAEVEPMAIGPDEVDLIAHRAQRIADLSSQALGYLSHLSGAAGYDAERRREHAQRYIDRD